MATVTAEITLTSSDLLTDTLSLSTDTSITAANTAGLKRTTLTSTSKVTKLAVLDGDADVPDVTTIEGQYVDITDNHGLKKRYVFTDAGASGAADNTIIVADTDIGSTSTPDSSLIGGICVQIADGDEQRDILEQLRVVINNTNGHNGSITAAAVASEADGPQSCTMTNPTTGESGVFLIDAANATWEHIDNTADSDATNSGVDHPTIVDKNEFSAPAFVYVKNTSAYHATNNRVFLYYDNHGAEDIMEIRGGAFAFIPLSPNNNLKAYTSTSGTVVESMVFGTNA
tara:strand:- start:5555 stop:6412 length:858 start_codon:yes stop_codon:yes gene_type:complete